jgi:hypothetical protein
VGVSDRNHSNLKELCRRSETSQDYDEWQARLTQDHKALLEAIIPLLGPGLMSHEELRLFFSCIEVETWSFDYIEDASALLGRRLNHR